MPSLAAIADSLPGATRLAAALYTQGARVVLSFGNPCVLNGNIPPCDALIAGLELDRATEEQAVEAILDLLSGVRDSRQIFYHYDSIFSSRSIGAVIEALMRELGTAFTVAVPASPSSGHTQYMGHLFIDGVPAHETPLRTDANLVRLLQTQTRRRVGLLRWRSRGNPEGEITLVDALEEADLAHAAEQFADARLLTGSHEFAAHLPKRWGLKPRTTGTAPGEPLLILADGESDLLRQQIEFLESANCPYHIDMSPGESV